MFRVARDEGGGMEVVVARLGWWFERHSTPRRHSNRAVLITRSRVSDNSDTRDNSSVVKCVSGLLFC